MLGGLVRYLWGDLDREEIKKFSLLSLIFFCLIGAYWVLRTQKDAIFNAMVGIQYQPTAKMVSLVVVIGLALFYSKLVDAFKKNTLLIGLSSLYAIGFLVTSYFLQHPTIGLPNTALSSTRYFGWFVYLFIESFGSIMVGLFWAFVNSSTKTESAKKGYPLVVAGAQTGSILGSFLSFKSQIFGNAPLFVVAAISMFAIVPLVYLYLAVVPLEYRTGNTDTSAAKPKTGMLEGLFILLSRPYVLGIFALSTLYEVVGTILDYQMKVLAKQTYTTTEAFASFSGLYGMMTNGLSLVFAIVGTSFLMRRYGLRFCLVLFPIATGLVVAGVYFKPMLWVVTGSLIIIKGLSYALNNPSKEMMYIPTTKDVKFKAKGWIDMFGGRSSKGAGSYINDFFKHNPADLLMYGTLISLGIVGVWVMVALYVGSTFNKLTKENKVIS